jgi:hypothetical protein
VKLALPLVVIAGGIFFLLHQNEIEIFERMCEQDMQTMKKAAADQSAVAMTQTTSRPTTTAGKALGEAAAVTITIQTLARNWAIEPRMHRPILAIFSALNSALFVPW